MSIKIKAKSGVSNKEKAKKRHGEELEVFPVKVAKMKKRELTISETASGDDVKVHKPKGVKQKLGKKSKTPLKASLDKRERRLLKLKSKKHSEVVMQLLPMWEQFRRNAVSKEKRCECIQEVLKVSKNIIPDLCMAHDTSRILEDCVKHGTESQRWEIFSEIHKKFVILAKSRYARFVLLKLMKYGDKQHRLEMFKAFRGRIQRLTQHRFASEIIDTLYNDYATATQRNEMIQEFYGNRHALRLGEHESYNLEDTLKLHPDKSEVILNNLTVTLINLVTKGLNRFSIVQHLLLEYLNSAFTFNKATASSSSSTSVVTGSEKPSTTDLSQPNAAIVPVLIDDSLDCKESLLPKSFNDNFTTLLEALIDGQLVPMMHTREGVRCALKILWACNPQKRKLLVKGLKTCIKNIAFNEHGHLFIIGLIDAVDDIVLLQKTVFREILDDLELFVMHPNARKVLLYMLSPRDSRHFSPQLINSILTPGDTNMHTKKLLGVRALEMRTCQSLVLPALLNLAQEKLTELFIGDASDPTNEAGIIARKDLGRLILLSEILDKSAPHNLNPDVVIPLYNRSNDNTRVLVVKCTIPESDLSAYKVSRKAALEKLIACVLVPEFNPSGGDNRNGQSKLNVSRDDLRLSRHKMAVALVEAYLAKLKNPDIKSFTGGNGLVNGEDEECDDDRDDEDDDDGEEEEEEDEEKEDDKHMSIDEIFTDLQIDSKPFIERPEGVIIIRRLLQGEKEHKTFTFGRLIMKNVPMKNLCSWTKCNRTCYLLVNLWELGDEAICKQLKEGLTPMIETLKISPLSGAKILYNHLTK